jgi:deoxyhypusine synthase
MATTKGPVFIIHPVQNHPIMNLLSVNPPYPASNRKYFHVINSIPVYPLEEYRKNYCAGKLNDQQTMETKITITQNTLISDVQKSFQQVYSHLSLQFFKKTVNEEQESSAKKFFTPEQAFGKVVPLKKEGDITLSSTMTVSQLIEEFSNTYGIYAQVLRKSANLWLEITLTNNWTLQQQNDHGREISI